MSAQDPQDPDPWADLMELERMEAAGAPLEAQIEFSARNRERRISAAIVEAALKAQRERQREGGRLETGRVYLGEALACLRGLEDASVDMVAADPPYSSGGFTRGDRNQDARAKYERDGVAVERISFTGDNRDGRSWAYWCALWLSECRRVLKPGSGYALMFTDWRQLPLATDAFQAGGLVWRGIVTWDKGEGARGPHTGYFRHQCEYVVWGSAGALGPSEHGGPWPGAHHIPVRQDDKFHMTGKPTELMRELVKVCPPGGLVVDPFAGSGTTLVACELEGRRGIGFELEPENVRISNARIQAARESIDAKAKLDGQRPLFREGGAVA